MIQREPSAGPSCSRTVGALAMLCVLLQNMPAGAAQGTEIVSQGCDLQRSELERLVLLELGAVIQPRDEVSGYRVEITCLADDIQLRIEDPLTQKALERTVQAPVASTPEPERLVALSIAQLYRAAWLELLADDPPPLPSPSPAPEAPQTRAAARSTLHSVLRPAEPGTPSEAELRLGIVARGLRHDPLVAPAFGVAYGFSPAAPWRIGAVAQFEAGAEQRATGRVEARLWGGHLRVAYQPNITPCLLASLDAQTGLVFASITGKDVAPDLIAGSVEGIAFDGALGAGVALDTQPVRLGAAARAGVVSNAPIGYVDGDNSVNLNGPWLGGFVHASLVF